MKKIFACLTVLFFITSSTAVFAQIPLGIPAAPLSPQALERIGVVAAAKGQVELTTPGQVGRVAQSGQPIFMGDEVKTDAQGHLQILLLDETVFTIGPNSAIVIDEFVYNPDTRDGNIRASITRGVFRYVSGKIAAKNPDKVSLKLPTATLGFRGTIVAGSVGANGQGLVGLMGPGDKNDSGAKIGSFVITGEGGGKQEVGRSGFGVEIDGKGGVSHVFQFSNEQVNGLVAGLTPPQAQEQQGQGDSARGPAGEASGGAGEKQSPLPEGGAGERQGPRPPFDANAGEKQGPAPLFAGTENMGQLSGENRMGIYQDTGWMNTFNMLADDMNNQTNTAAQDYSQNTGSAQTIVRDTLKSDLANHAGGVFHYENFYGNFSLTHSSTTYQGTFKASIDINFGANVIAGSNIGGNSSYVQILVPDLGLTPSSNLNGTLFNSGSELSFFNLNEAISNFTVTVQLQDIVKQAADSTIPPVVDIATQAKVQVVYTDTSGDYNGSGVMIAPIQPLATNTVA